MSGRCLLALLLELVEQSVLVFHASTIPFLLHLHLQLHLLDLLDLLLPSQVFAIAEINLDLPRRRLLRFLVLHGRDFLRRIELHGARS